MLICILIKNVINSCSVRMMLFLHLQVKPLMTLTTVLYLSCALISGHLAMMSMDLIKRRYASFLVVFDFFFQAEDGIRDHCVTGVQTCALPIFSLIHGGTVGRLVLDEADETVGAGWLEHTCEGRAQHSPRPRGHYNDLRHEIGRASCRERV